LYEKKWEELWVAKEKLSTEPVIISTSAIYEGNGTLAKGSF
jgi:hypothetical protein